MGDQTKNFLSDNNNNNNNLYLYFISMHILTYLSKYKKCYPKKQYSYIQGTSMGYFTI